MKKRNVVAGGKTYSSLKDCAQAHNMDSKLLSLRLSRGWTIEEALGIEQRISRPSSRGTPITIELNGTTKTYNSIKQAAIEFNQDPRTVRARISVHGWSIEQALGIEQKPDRKAHNRKRVKFTVNNISYEYESITDAAHKHNLDEFLVFRRINRDKWTFPQALELVPPPEHVRECHGYIYLVTNTITNKQYVGQTMRSISARWESHVERAERTSSPKKGSLAYDIVKYSPEKFHVEQIDKAHSHHELNELERYWIEKHNTMSPNGYNRSRGGSGIITGLPQFIDGKRYSSISDAARMHGIKEALVSSRLRSGWTIEQALELDLPPESHKSTGRKINITEHGQEIVFDSISSLAEHYNIEYATLIQRLVKLNWTPEQAVGLEPPPKWVHPMHAFKLQVNEDTFFFKSKAEAAKHFGFERWETIRKRLKRGWTINQALGLEQPPISSNEPIKISVNINGKTVVYRSQTEAANAHNICFKRVSSRVKLGWSYEEALEIIPRKPKNK